MGQPAYAGVAVGLIFIALIGSFLGYRLYKRLQWRKVRKQQEAADALAAEELSANRAQTPVHFPMRSTSPGPSMIGSLYGDALQYDSVGRRSMSKASMYSVPTQHQMYNGSSASEYAFPSRSRANSQGLMRVSTPLGGEVSQEPSMPGSPVSHSVVGDGIASPSEAYDGPTHSRALSSASSTMTLRRQYAAAGGYRSTTPSSSMFGSAGGYRSTTPNGYGPAPRRDSYLPHLPGNRDQIQIVPPQPLGFSFGMAQALDQKTLAFAKGSGIGDFDEEFSRGLLWAAQSPAEAEAAIEAELGRGATFSAEERERYLAEGPSSLGGNNLTPAMRGAIHNMLYNSASQPNSSGNRTPDAPASRPRSPTQNNWDGSVASSDIGPSVSQRGVVPPSHPLEHNYHPSLEQQRSPLSGLMGTGNVTGEGDMTTTTMSDSPILQPSQNQEQASVRQARVAAANATSGHNPQDSFNSTHAGVVTPGLMSSSDSRSQSSHEVGPASLSNGQAGNETSAAAKDGRIHVWGQGDEALSGAAEPAPVPAQAKRSSRGWLMGGWRRSSGGAPSAA